MSNSFISAATVLGFLLGMVIILHHKNHRPPMPEEEILAASLLPVRQLSLDQEPFKFTFWDYEATIRPHCPSYPHRIRMVEDLLNRFHLFGYTRAQVIDLLGTKFHPRSHENLEFLEYELVNAYPCGCLESLVFYFAHDKVYKIKVKKYPTPML